MLQERKKINFVSFRHLGVQLQQVVQKQGGLICMTYSSLNLKDHLWEQEHTIHQKSIHIQISA